jgi:hypothetical protein
MITYPTQWDEGDGENDVQMRPVVSPVPVAVDAKWTTSNVTIAATLLDASAVAAASYARRYIPATLEGHLHKLTVVVATLSGDNEIQTVSIDNASSGGTFTLSVDGGAATAGIAYDAAAAAVKSAIELVSTATVTVTGGAGPATDWIVEFGGTHAGVAVDLMVGDGGSLTGGTTVVGVVETQRGGGAIAVTWGGVTVGTIYAAGTSVYYVRPTDGNPLAFTTTDTATTFSISSVTTEGIDPINIDLLPSEVTPVDLSS